MSGLKQIIRDKIGVQMIFNVQEARNLDVKIELLIMEQTHSTNYRRYGGVDNKALSDKGKTPLAMSEIVETVNVGVQKKKSVAVEGGKGNTSVPTKNSNPYARPFSVKYNRCGEVGHCSNEYPKRKALNVVEKDDDIVENEVCGSDRNCDYEEYEKEEYTCVVRKLMLSATRGDKAQLHKLFHTRCTVQGSLCDLVINSGSQENIISKDVVERLQLEMETHPSPYVIGWIKEVGGIQVHELLRCPSLLASTMMRCTVMWWIWMLVIFYLGVLGSMMWLSTRVGVTCIN